MKIDISNLAWRQSVPGCICTPNVSDYHDYPHLLGSFVCSDKIGHINFELF